MKPQDLTPFKILGADALPPDALWLAFVAAFANYLIGLFKPTPGLQRPDLGGAALRELGFERQGLHQLWMLRALSGD